jgi:hypothetical protein
MTATRRLAAILAADVAGYSRLMGADEEGTHERLKVHLGELVNPKIAEHRGRIVKNTARRIHRQIRQVSWPTDWGINQLLRVLTRYASRKNGGGDNASRVRFPFCSTNRK